MDLLREQLKRHEGFRDRVYLDCEGKLTCGYGHHLFPGDRISRQVAELLLDIDLSETTNDFYKLPYERIKKLNTARRRVIMNMLFNLGLQGLLKFVEMWEAIDREDFKAAAREMLESKWAKQVGQRAVELAGIMERGE